MTDPAWIDAALTSARPQAVGALLRYFRDLDTAEEAFQDACLRALKSWPQNGPPRDPAAWLIMVGRNAAIDGRRRQARQQELPDEAEISDLDDAEGDLAERLDNADYRDDVLRLLVVCCHPELPATQQIALALRIVSGLTVKQIARAFLVTEAAMEQRITRAKRRVAEAGLPFETPHAVDRAERLGAVAAMIYLIFNEGYSAAAETAGARATLSDEAIRLARLLLRLFPTEPEIMGLTALMLLQHSRLRARLDADGQIVLLEDQDRSLWNRERAAEGERLLDRALAHRRPGPYQLQAAIAALHLEDVTDWPQIAALYAELARYERSPVVELNRAVAVAMAEGPERGLELMAALDLPGYHLLHAARADLLRRLGRGDEAAEAYRAALALEMNAADRAFLEGRLAEVASE